MTDPVAYRPGRWYGVIGAGATVLLPPDQRARVAGIWEALDQGADFEEALDLLIADGLRALPAFVLVSRQGAATRALVRGGARARFTAAGEEFELSGLNAGTWAERTLFEVTASQIDLHEPADDRVLSVAEGLIRLSRLSTPPPTAPSTTEDSDAAAAPVALILPGGETVPVDRVLLIGRSPEAARADAAERPRLVAVPSPHHEISATHLEVRPGSGADQGTAVVTDLGSTNGTVLVQPGLPPEDLRPGVGVALVAGALIDLGDGVTLQVVAD